MLILIHHSQRIIYTFHRTPEAPIFWREVWSFEPAEYTQRESGMLLDTRSASTELLVHVPPDSEVIPWEPKVDWPEFRHRLKVHSPYLTDPGLLAEQVWRLAAQGAKGFRLHANVPGPARDPESGPSPELAGSIVRGHARTALYVLDAPQGAAGRVSDQVEATLFSLDAGQAPRRKKRI